MPASRTAHGWLPAAGAVFAAGWGANQFTPLSSVYRTREHWPSLQVALMFTTYLAGFLPALLTGAHAAGRFGRRRVVLPALLLSAAASALLAAAAFFRPAAYAGRLATGVAAGLVISVGGAWLRELSAGAGPTKAARRVTWSTGAGFAAGALVAGVVAQWLPHPLLLPCLLHCLLALGVLVALRRTPDTTPPPVPDDPYGPWPPAAAHPRFVRVVLPAGPAVFAASTVAYVVLPPLVAERTSGYAPLFSGLVTALTLLTGLTVQPLAERLDHAHSARATLTAMATVICGLLLSALAVHYGSMGLVLLAAVLLGAGYGLTLASGLREIERLTRPRACPSTVSLYHGVTYSGFLTPLLLAVTAGAAPYPALLAGLAAIGLLCLMITAWHSRRHLP
ncbi:MFS transporter [Streptomyces seoulensis]|uniref:MFS transporter n=1 Tax=Streptomyces seoulensis TaxID=73044 RepID=UPI001FCC5F3C|nr:MFS transporter [Streptomyces seoulensis]BDH06026.1 MFS transporter [Streptomyces seoulensis]